MPARYRSAARAGSLAVLLAVTFACQRSEPVVEAAVLPQEEVLLGPRTAAVLREPAEVRAYRVLSPFDREFEAAKKTKPLLHGYPILAETAVQDRTAKKIAAILLDPASYDATYAMACLFEPRHALRFRRGAEVVDVVICFECGDLDIVPARSLGEQRTMQPFGRVREPLYAAVTEIFPTR